VADLAEQDSEIALEVAIIGRPGSRIDFELR
jgi:hypothetical protein